MADIPTPSQKLNPPEQVVDVLEPVPLVIANQGALGIAQEVRPPLQQQIEPIGTDATHKPFASLGDYIPLRKSIKEAIEKYVGEVVADTISLSVVGVIVGFLDVAEWGGFKTGTLMNAVKRGSIDADRRFPTGLLDLQTIGALVNMGVMTDAAGRDEALSQGIDGRRFALASATSMSFPGLGEAVELLRTKQISDASFHTLLELNRVPAPFHAHFQALLRRYLDITPVVQSWLRKDISDSYFMDYLSRLGFDQTDSEVIKKLAFFIPPVADLVRMAVREAFDEGQSAKLNLDAEFPGPFKDAAEKQGVSEEWAKKYWRAHWELPSPTQAFEMHHRDQITLDELKALLKALDYAPVWRDKMLAISYNTITRVDVRRMYEMGIIDANEVERQYRHSGYSPENAARLRKFVEADVFESTVSPIKARLLSLFREGIVDEFELRAFLVDLQMPPDRIDRFIAAEKMLAEEEYTKKLLMSIKKQFLASRVTVVEAGAKLAALGLSAVSVAKTVVHWVEEKKSRIVRLSAMDVHKALQKKIIDEKQARALLQDRGMSDAEITIFIQLDSPSAPEPV